MDFNDISKSFRTANTMYGSRAPWAIAAAGASALLAPLFLKNDDRGYAGTAAFTTPLIGATFVAAPHLMSAGRSGVSQFNAFRKTQPFTFSAGAKGIKVGVKPLQEIQHLQANKAFRSIYGKAKIRYYAGGSGQTPPFDTRSAFSEVMDMLKEERESGAFSHLTQNAITEAVRAGISPDDMLDGSKSLNAEHLPTSFEHAEEILKDYSSNESFVKRLRYRIKSNTKLTSNLPIDGGIQSLQNHPIHPIALEDALVDIENALGKGGRGTRVANNLKASLSRISEGRAWYETLPGGKSRLLGVTMTNSQNRRQSMQLPMLQDPDTKLYRIGKDWNREGAVRDIYNRTGSIVDVHDNLEYISSHLKDHDWEATINTHESSIVSGGRSPDETWKIQNLPDMNDVHMRKDTGLLHANTVVPTQHPEFGGSTYDKLDHDGLKAVTKDMVAMNYMSTSESKVSAGAFLKRSASAIQEGGVVDHSSNFAANIAAKPISFTSETVAAHKMPPTMSSESIGRELYLHQANVAPQYRKIFELLPETGNTISEETAAQMEQHMIDHVKSSAVASDEEVTLARKVHRELMETFRSNPNRWNSLREFASLGEGNALTPALTSAKIRMVYNRRVDRLHEGITVGGIVDDKTILGMHQFEPVLGMASQNRILGINRTGDFADLQIEGIFGSDGLKTQRSSVKGHQAKTLDGREETEFKEQLISRLNMSTGHGGAVKGVDSWVAEEFNKEKGPGIEELHQAVDIANEIENERLWTDGDTSMWRDKSVGERNVTLRDLQDHVSMFKNQVEQNGYRRDAYGRLIEDAEQIAGLNPLALAERQERLAVLSRGFLDKVAPGIPNIRPRADHTLLSGFAETVAGGMGEKTPTLAEYLHHTVKGVVVSATGTSRMGMPLPGQVKITRDLLMQLELQGQHEAVRSLLNHSVSDGDRIEAGKYFDHLAGGDFNKPMGDIIPVSDVKSAKLGTIESRMRGSMFSPESHPTNFSIDLGQDLGFGRYVPVLGRKAARGGTDKFGPGEFKATKSEVALNEFYERLEGVDTSRLGQEDTLAKSIRAQWEKTKAVLQDDFFSKEGLASSGMTHDNSISPIWMGRAAEWDPTIGGHNPFLLGMSRDQAESIPDKAIRERALRGEQVEAILNRNPTKNPSLVKVRLDESLGFGQMGAPNVLGASHGADFDGDFGNLFFDGSSEFRKAADKAIHDVNSLQHQQFRDLAGLQNYDSSNLPGHLVRESRKDQDRVTKAGKYVKSAGYDANGVSNVEHAMNARLAHKYTGHYGNLDELFKINLAENDLLQGDRRGILQLDNLLFHTSKQYTIAAGKHKVGMAGDPLEPYNNMKAALSTGDDELMQRMISNIAKSFDVKSVLTPESIDLYNLNPETNKPGDVRNVYHDFAESDHGRELIQKMVKGHTVNAKDQAQMLSGMPGEFTRAKRVRAAQNIGSDLSSVQGSFRDAGYGAEAGADALRFANQSMKDAWSGAKAAMHESGALKVGLAGLGIAAAAGFMSTRVSSNEHRPEERAGVSDRVPGEQVAGSRASVNPVRRHTPAPAQTRTAVVASLNNKVDLEVRARAEDRQSGAELEKMVRRSAGNQGTTNVTVNRVGGWKNSSSKLRMREQIRQNRDSQPQA